MESRARSLAGELAGMPVEFDSAGVAGQLGITVDALRGRMLEVIETALVMDAVDIAAQDMRASGQRLGTDGTPPGFPVEHLAAVVRSRFFPERVTDFTATPYGHSAYQKTGNSN